MKTELILCFPREKLLDPSLGETQDDGVKFFSEEELCSLHEHVVIAPRHLMEKGGALAEDYAHIASYTAVVETDEDGNFARVFRYARAAAGGESMLHGNTSIGVGGHVNPWFRYNDVTFLTAETIAQSVSASSRNELEEEIGLHAGIGKPVYMYAPTNEVGKYHICALSVARVGDLDKYVGEEDAIGDMGPWVPGVDDPNMEAWSVILAHLIRMYNAGDRTYIK